MRRTFLVAAAVLMFPSLATAQTGRDALPFEASRLAYFSLQRAFAESADGKAARATLSTLQATRSREIEARSARLRSQREELQRSATVLAPAAVAAREQEIERFQLDLQRFTEDAQAEFLGVQRAAESAFLGRLRPAVDTVAREKRLALIFDIDAGPLFWGDPALDITADIVTALDRPGP